MRLLLIILVLILVGIVGIFGIRFFEKQNAPLPQTVNMNIQTNPSGSNQSKTEIIVQNLEVPWAIGFLPDGTMLVTERKGTIRTIQDGILNQTPLATINEAKASGEGGLLGIAIDPQFEQNNYIYVYYTYDDSGANTKNRVVRYKLTNNNLSDRIVIVDAIPGASNHDGGRIKFGPDGFLYITTGDAQEPSLSQNTNSLAGKILRVTRNGKPAPANPFNNPVYSYGHRNSQGIAWNSEGELWATEHGRSGVQSGLDEVNLIEIGKNYGWPTIQGNETKSGMITAKANSGDTTWAPSGAAFVGDSLFFGGLRGQTLYEAVIENNEVKQIKEHFNTEYGRIREVIVGPDGMLYITTSNLDGRGLPKEGDDKIIRINPKLLN